MLLVGEGECILKTCNCSLMFNNAKEQISKNPLIFLSSSTRSNRVWKIQVWLSATEPRPDLMRGNAIILSSAFTPACFQFCAQAEPFP